MSFSGPLWLIGLLPWAGVALYLLRGRRRKEPVPFLDLWLGPVLGPNPKRRIAAPPLAVALALLATLLALLAAAGPQVNSGPAAPRVTIVLDRGATLSARGKSAPRFVETAQ